MCIKWVMEDRVSVERYTASSGCGSCRKKDQRRRQSAMSFWIRLRSLAVSNRACASCATRTTTSHCRQAGFLSFAWQWPELDSFTIATCAQAVLGLASSCCLALRDFFRYCGLLFHNRSKKPLSYCRFHAKNWQQEHHFAQVEQK